MKCRSAAALIGAVLAALLAPAVAAGWGEGSGDRHGRWAPPDPELGPLVCGTTSIVDGTFVWTDYAYDDRGANTVETSIVGPRGAEPGSAARSGGDAVYEAWAAPGNAADLIQLQIARRPWGLSIRGILETLVDPELPVLGLAFDTDADPTTGAASLPGGAWPALDPLGIDLVAIVDAAETRLLAWDGAAWTEAGRGPAHVDPDRNVLDGLVWRGHLPPMRGTWRVFGVLGVTNPATGGNWSNGGGEIFDLAFVGDEPQVKWQDMRQSDVLVGALGSGLAAAELDFSKLRRHVNERVDELAPGFKTFLFHSRLALPEGVTLPAPDVSLGQHEYLGPYQPYQVFIPETMPAGNPLLVSLHGANTNHLLSIFTVPDGAYVGTSREFSEDPFLIGMFVPDFGANARTAATAKIWPLGRGETLRYTGIGELDVLEAVQDAMARLGTDPDRVTLHGDSMGGFGAYRLGTRYPDRWAAIIPVIGGGEADRELFENLSNLPVRQINGALDPLVSYDAALEDVETLDALEIPFVFYGLLDRGHDPSANSQCVRDQAAVFVRDTDPSRIVYRIDPETFQQDPARDLDIVYDAAYWLSGLAVADPARIGEVRAFSRARPHADFTIERSDRVLGNTSVARDLCGPDPAFAPGWSPAFPDGESWREVELARVSGAPLPQSNALELELVNLESVTVDLERAGFESGRSGEIRVRADADVELTLIGLRPGQKVFVEGRPIARARGFRPVSLGLTAGEHSLAIGRSRGGWKRFDD